MRLLITTDTVGGVWSFTRDLTDELLRRGHAIALVSFGKAPSEAQEAWISQQGALSAEQFQFTAASVPLEWEQENASSFEDGDMVLHSVAEGFEPDLLLSNQFCFGASSLRLPRVVVAHSDVLSWAKAAKPSALTPSPWINHYTSIVQGGLMGAGAVVAPTHWMLGALTRNFFLPRGGMVIPNGCSIETPEVLPERRLQAVSAGRLWDEGKGLEVLLGCRLDLPVLVAGETQISGEPEGAASPSVSMLGELSSDVLHDLFCESAIYLCTSLYEPFGLAPLEAALCGCAVVARDLPSLREVWADNAVYFSDAESLREIVRNLAGDPRALAEAQSRARRHALQYTVERMTAEYLRLFDSLSGERRTMPHVA